MARAATPGAKSVSFTEALQLRPLDDLSGKFTGTDNPRELRALEVLMRGPVSREDLDKRAGCTNSPELIRRLRARGLELPCERIDFIDRDGNTCHPGVYRLTDSDRLKLRRWQEQEGSPE